MQLFVSREKHAMHLLAMGAGVITVLSLVITFTTSNATNAMRAETQKPISEMDSKVHSLQTEQEGIKKQVGELDQKFTTEIASVKQDIGKVETLVRDSEKSVKAEIQTTSGKIDTLTNMLLQGKIGPR